MPDKPEGNQNGQHAKSDPNTPASEAKAAPIEPSKASLTALVPNVEKKDSDEHNATAQQHASISEQAFVDRVKKSDRWMIALTAVIAIGGAVSAGIFWQQLSAMQGQLGEMQIDQRPWIEIGLSPYNSFTYDDKGNAFFALETGIKNIGKLPTQYVAIRGKLIPWLSSTIPIEERDEVCKEARDRKLNPRNIGLVVFPNDIKHPLLPLAIPAPDVIKWKDAADSTPIMAICVDYVFVTDGSHHHTGLLLEIDQKGTDPNRPWTAVRPFQDIRKENLILNENPSLPWDID